ncbi:MAG: DUF5715 family protein [Patescibacteria group bacterium]
MHGCGSKSFFLAAIVLIGIFFVGQSAHGECKQRTALIPASLKGSKAALARENSVADRFKLERFDGLSEVKAAVATKKLIRFSDTAAYAIDQTLGEQDITNRAWYAHARPWVKTFLDDVLGETHRRFGGRCLITSLVRTTRYQKLVRRAYPRAAAKGDIPAHRSSHLTGSTVDIAFREMPRPARPWLRRRLLALETAQAIQATEERYCFHVMVFPDYAARAKKIR